MQKKFAHTPPENKPDIWHDLDDHTESVAKECGRLASKFNQENLGKFIGYYHDAGKYTTNWQTYLKNSFEGKPSNKVGHSFYGAVNVYKKNKYNIYLSNIVFSHHTELKNHKKLCENVIRELNRVDVDFVKLQTENLVFEKDPITLSPTDIRMLFSCLIDADRKDTESFYKPYISPHRDDKKFHSKFLNDYAKYLKRFHESESKLNLLRKKVSDSCKKHAFSEKGLFTLTAPTGVGKTLASLNFAINHISHRNLDRLINTIPYTSIIDQMSTIYKEMFGEENVLEHHSNIMVEELSSNKEIEFLRNLNSENWNSPFILTTTVQFFDTLFSNKPKKLRKLHNYTNSLIILDEPQMLPTDKLKPLIEKLKDLVENYNCSVLLCTATPFDYEFIKLTDAKEICDNYKEIFNDLKRVKYTLINEGEELDFDALIEKIELHEQVLCVVNTKQNCSDIFEQFRHLDYAYCLTTNMTPKHRKEVIKEINIRLKKQEKCLVISTQLIECGVDLDFPVVFRALAPLPSIIQSAGRCNREGKLESGVCFVFRYGSFPERFYEVLSNKTLKYIKNNLKNIDDPEYVKEYFKDLHDLYANEHEVSKHESYYEFEESAKFKLIEEETLSVIADIKSSLVSEIKNALVENEGYLKQNVKQKIQNNSVSVDTWNIEGNVVPLHEDYPDIKVWKHGYDNRTGILNI
jgi:CRISPR-associated endonuclease/helicase Cas3